jgi:hypothetical protein
MAKKEQTVDVKKVMLGMTGERIVAHLLRKQGHIVEESLDPFDTEKDMLMDGLRIEVKTQVPFLVEDSFAVSPSQLKKICNSHRVYFLSVPPSKNADPNSGCIYELDTTQEFKCHRRVLANGRETVCIPRNQAHIKVIGRVTDPKLLNTLKQLSTSYI